MSGEIEEFATPSRGLPTTNTGQSSTAAKREMMKKEPKTVTPPERDDAVPEKQRGSAPSTISCSSATLPVTVSAEHDSPVIKPSKHPNGMTPSSAGKHVRFDGEEDNGEEEKEQGSSDSAKGNRSVVSRRGGRYGSPSRPLPLKPKEAVVEYKTYRSPSRKRDENDTVPSLCSTGSGGMNSSSEFEKPGKEAKAVGVKQEEPEEKLEEPSSRRPSSISCDKSLIETSPLTSHETEVSEPKKPKQEKVADEEPARKNNVTFSPTPPPTDKNKKTPVKSPPSTKFQCLPSLDDDNLKSPTGIFLSPHTSTPNGFKTLGDSPSLDQGDQEDSAKENDGGRTNESSRLRDSERERFVATPTDFAVDYGKGHHLSGSFDGSNVLAWLQSPTGLFSPGGMGSAMNTPKGGGAGGNGAPRTPRTPTVSTSFFFSDVASLPRGNEFTSPKPGDGTGKRSQRGYSNIICISPLASSKSRNGHHANTPINYRDVFASPEGKDPRGVSLLDDSPAKGTRARSSQRSSRDPSLDAVHLAERDLMEDEDLSVLLQLASNTPRSGADRGSTNAQEGPHVFRSQGANNTDGGYRKSNRDGGNNENLPSLQLPMIDGRDGEPGGTRLSRKSQSREHAEADDFVPPTLGIRSTSSGGAKEIYLGAPRGEVSSGRSSTKGSKEDTKSDATRKGGSNQTNSKASKKPKKSMSAPAAYSMPPHYHPGADVPYYPMPNSMPGMPPGGSMRVVVGGPPPSRVGSKSSMSPPGPHGGPVVGSPHRPPPYNDGVYPPPGAMPYPPPPGHYPHHHHVPPPHMSGMGVPPHPYHSHYPPPPHPPPRHMPMYSAQHPPTSKPSSKSSSKKTKQNKSKAPAKRPAPAAVSSKGSTGSANKKPRKSPSSASKKKAKTPPASDREKSAETPGSAGSKGGNDRAAALAAAILRGVTMRPSGKWQAQLYFAGKSRYIGVFDTREKAALAYEIAREKLKSEKSPEHGALSAKATEAAVNSARKAAFEGVNERDPRIASK